MGDAKGLSPEQQMRRLTRRSFVLGAGAALAGYGAWRWLTTATSEWGVPWPMRRVLSFNERLVESLGSPHQLAPTFAAERVKGLGRTNGRIGLFGDVDSAGWELRIQHEDGRLEQRIRLSELQELPHVDLVTELKCVEGWSEVMHFRGVRLLDFAMHKGLATRSGRAPDPRNPQDLYRYVYVATPDEDYFVGLDTASALHPQTLLCDMMNWQPLSREHGAPLRLYLTVKYGYKSLKRIGLIRFQEERPADYWAGRGYDWYAGL